MANTTILYGYWLSSCTWRVRVAMHLKNMAFEERSIDIVREKAQLTPQFRAINPSQKVPALFVDGATIVESMAIIDYLDDTRPDPPLKPSTPLQRARMQEICEPLQNIGLKSYFETDDKYTVFTKHWTERRLQSLEELLKNSAGAYSVGDQMTKADLCLVPQVYNAVTRHKLDLGKYPIVSKLYEKLLKEESFRKTHPMIVKDQKK
ncbi:probable maleylacetoacetate isomerase 1 isoform X2 [Pieris brassicae]|uniref:probable maleylacetoacetate isomerase 1 isoform X2 n=1 Tax=Pieris brassicae TaxID=7116 RepID=UPI001E65EBA7|nr:probable maleylacetoacetate isomerase 1 isoform X2 [Pieris brassicae]